MEKIMMNIVIDIIGIVIVLILYGSFNKKNAKIFYDQQLFIYLLLSILLLLIVDIAPWIVDGQTFKGARSINIISNSLLYFFNPLPAVIWACYIEYKIFQDKDKLKKKLYFFAIPIIINTILSISSLTNKVYFTVSDSNVYTRNSLSWFAYILTLVYLLYTTVRIFEYKKRMRRDDFNSFLLFIIIPILFSLLQMIFYGLSLMWIGTAIASINLFVKVQNDMASTDFLTGLSNRRQLETYLQIVCNKKSSDYKIAGLMIDIDCFKSINDNYGHAKGDEVLINLSRYMEKALDRNDFLARYAGDEFVVISKFKYESEVTELIQSLYNNLYIYNENSQNDFIIDFSVGYVTYDVTESIDKFINRIDKKMYEVKNRKKEKAKD